MKNFLQYSFTDYKSDSAFCNQRNGSPELFDCLFIYSHKVPSAKFYIELSFNKNGIKGYISIFIDTTATQFSARSLHWFDDFI